MSQLCVAVSAPAVMAEQLRLLAEVAMLPNVTLQVIPFDAQSYEPMSTAFTLFRFGHEMYSDRWSRDTCWTPWRRTARG